MIALQPLASTNSHVDQAQQEASTDVRAPHAADEHRISYDNDRIEALNRGLGSLMDADLAAESAQLHSLQIKQQLGSQSRSISNQAPRALISLLKTA